MSRPHPFDAMKVNAHGRHRLAANDARVQPRDFREIFEECQADARAEVAVPRRGWLDAMGAGGEA